MTKYHKSVVYVGGDSVKSDQTFIGWVLKLLLKVDTFAFSAKKLSILSLLFEEKQHFFSILALLPRLQTKFQKFLFLQSLVKKNLHTEGSLLS